MDGWNASLAIALVAVSCIAMIAVEIAWRRLSRARPDLPMWRFLRRIGVRPDKAEDAAGAKALQHGEILCAMCSSREECHKRLSAPGAGAPPEHCPNARLFAGFGLRTERTAR